MRYLAVKSTKVDTNDGHLVVVKWVVTGKCRGLVKGDDEDEGGGQIKSSWMAILRCSSIIHGFP